MLAEHHSVAVGCKSQDAGPGEPMRGVWEAGWGKERVLATNGPGCGTQWELASLQSPPWVGALPGKAGRLCNMQTLPGSSTTTRFCSKAGNGLQRVPSAEGESGGVTLTVSLSRRNLMLGTR